MRVGEDLIAGEIRMFCVKVLRKFKRICACLCVYEFRYGPCKKGRGKNKYSKPKPC